MKSIALFHPFTANAIGLRQQDLLHSHSRPHMEALIVLQKEGYTVLVDYFCKGAFFNIKVYGELKKRFWPLTSLMLEKKGWRKEHSLWHFCYTFLRPSDVTIINMSGLLSPYTIRLGNILHRRGKPYIAMLGGVHVAFHEAARLYFERAHHIIVHTEGQRQELLRHSNFQDLDIRVVPLGVDTTIFYPSKTKRETELFELLMVSRITPLKQIELGIKAAAHCLEKGEQVCLTVIGPISDAIYYHELQELVTQYGIEANVVFKGALEHEQLVSYYQKADVLLLPSAHESFGMVMVEAMACGVPVVALKGSGGPDEIVKHNENGILCDASSYPVSVYDLLKEKSKLLQLRKASQRSVEEKWSIKETIKSMNASVEDCLRDNKL
ncbi:glycosyltransferase family 4 protein [Mangrovimonas sp. AS39]|uniref:glycosyltransferase family 4 protein n=1 Tax=Mangrovimonas futianensis TaxID=2895523 RepID=UPI001E5875D7|nr:glycosyltransferase family 4 protein [Mangrovimonas futianensis]MCF1191231.1 glycosyltransferase family 4 protein [Mangrovimonas futianensis]MCF1194926.1 glycosyltransferase family 4 protein [Mangrovimonas futianensis]